MTGPDAQLPRIACQGWQDGFCGARAIWTCFLTPKGTEVYEKAFAAGQRAAHDLAWPERVPAFVEVRGQV